MKRVKKYLRTTMARIRQEKSDDMDEAEIDLFAHLGTQLLGNLPLTSAQPAAILLKLSSVQSGTPSNERKSRKQLEQCIRKIQWTAPYMDSVLSDWDRIVPLNFDIPGKKGPYTIHAPIS